MESIIASAPGRAGIVGNPSDMYGGSVVSCSTYERAYCRLSPSDYLSVEAVDEKERILSLDDFEPRKDRLDISKSVLKWFNIDVSKARFKLSTWTDIPENAGLAGSTALLVSVFSCVAEYLGISMKPYDIAENARKIEANILGITCGFQDQYMAVFGGLNFIDFKGKESLKQLDSEPFATLETLGDVISRYPFVVAHTGIKRHSGQVHKSVRERWLEGEAEVVQGYAEIAAMGRKAKQAIIRERWEELAELMDRNHAIQQSLGASGEVNDRLIDVAKKNGALAAKLAGAGHGGTIIALTFDREATVSALRAAGADRLLMPRPSAGLAVKRVKDFPTRTEELVVVDY
jgi:galactokinase/mevalonate kinase-like predicted kinase